MRAIFKWGTLLGALMAIGCGSDETFDFSLLNNAAQQQMPPIAVADTFAVLGNGQLIGNVTANDTVNGALVSQFSPVGTSGGSVQISATGQLTYIPPPGQSNVVDTFTYTLSNGAGSSIATVTVNVGAQGFFVNNQAMGVETGSQQQPFNTLAEAVAAANGVNGAQIVVFRGDGTTAGLTTPVSLQANQGIRGFDPAVQPTLTGPIALSSGNAVRDLRIVGTVGAAINGTNAFGGSLTGVTVANSTGVGCALVNATGTFTATNCSILNTGSHGFVASADSTSLVWSVLGSTFTNVTGQDIFSNVTNTAAQNVTAANCVVNGGALQFVFVNANTTGTTIGLNMSNNTVNGNGTKGRGLSLAPAGTTVLRGVVSGNNITGCSSEGIIGGIGGNSNVRIRFNGNRTAGNQLNNGLNIFHFGAGSPNSGFIFTNNTSDGFILNQAGVGTFAVEQLSLFTTASNNSLPPTTGGTVIDAPSGSLGIP